MTRQDKITAATSPGGSTTGPAPSAPAFGVGPTLSETSGAVAGEAQSADGAGCTHTPQVTTALSRTLSQGTAPTLPPLPICGDCGRSPYGCVCNAPDGTEDMMPAEDVNRIVREWQECRAAPDDGGWALAEKSAYGMLKS